MVPILWKSNSCQSNASENVNGHFPNTQRSSSRRLQSYLNFVPGKLSDNKKITKTRVAPNMFFEKKIIGCVIDVIFDVYLFFFCRVFMASFFFITRVATKQNGGRSFFPSLFTLPWMGKGLELILFHDFFWQGAFLPSQVEKLNDNYLRLIRGLNYWSLRTSFTHCIGEPKRW